MSASSRIFNAKLTPLEEAESYQQRLATAIEEGKPLTASELAQQDLARLAFRGCWSPLSK